RRRTRTSGWSRTMPTGSTTGRAGTATRGTRRLTRTRDRRPRHQASGSSPRRCSSAASGAGSWGRRSGRPPGGSGAPGRRRGSGGILLGIVGASVVGRYGSLFGAVNRLRYGPLLGATLGLVGGGLVGVVAGLMVVSLPWSFVGLIVGMFVGPYLLPQGRRRLI